MLSGVNVAEQVLLYTVDSSKQQHGIRTSANCGLCECCGPAQYAVQGVIVCDITTSFRHSPAIAGRGQGS